MEGAPVHGPQLNGCRSHNGGRPGGLEQQSCVPKHPAGLHVDLDLATFNLQIKASFMACQDVKLGRKKLRSLPAAACVCGVECMPQNCHFFQNKKHISVYDVAWGSDNTMLRTLGPLQ